MNKRFSGKVLVVTGASKLSGIGAAVALTFAKEGASVLIADLVKDMSEYPGYVKVGSQNDLEILKSRIEELGVKAVAVPLDVTDSQSVRALGETVKKEFGEVDFLVNNAGGSPGVSTILQQEESAWLKTLDINLNGVFRVSRAVVPLMRKGGAVVNVSSRAGKVPSAFMGAYCTAKAGVIMLTKVMALEFSNMSIRVNCVCPGQIDTELGRWGWALKAGGLGKSLEEYMKELAQAIPLKRLGVPQDVANVIAYLCSDEASYLTGQAINVTGGQLMEL